MNRVIHSQRLLLAGILLATLCGGAGCPAPAEAAASLEACSKIDDHAARLRCYDGLAGRKPAAPGVIMALSPARETGGTEPSYLSRKWQLDEETRRRRFAIMPHRQNYVLPITYNFNQEKQAYEAANPGTKIQDKELKYQLSLKIKLWEDILGKDLDLWFGYTQLSFWQLYNTEYSSPFRETNYEPEFLLNYRTDMDIFGLMKSRYVQIGFNHQSNGGDGPLSRSWNRAVANFGFERDTFNLVLKTWARIPESADTDDNRDITSYLGYGELWLNTVWKNYHLGLMLRNNLRGSQNRGALQFEVSFPFLEHLNGYVQYFAGYGESLADYNHYTNRASLGVMLKDW
jgi:phospholipase A1